MFQQRTAKFKSTVKRNYENDIKRNKTALSQQYLTSKPFNLLLVFAYKQRDFSSEHQP